MFYTFSGKFADAEIPVKADFFSMSGVTLSKLQHCTVTLSGHKDTAITHYR